MEDYGRQYVKPTKLDFSPSLDKFLAKKYLSPALILKSRFP